MNRDSMEHWIEQLRRDFRNLQVSCYDFHHTANLFSKPYKEIEVSSEQELFELFVREEISEEEYQHHLPQFKKKPLTIQEQRIEQARNKPKMKDKYKSRHRLRSWE